MTSIDPNPDVVALRKRHEMGLPWSKGDTEILLQEIERLQRDNNLMRSSVSKATTQAAKDIAEIARLGKAYRLIESQLGNAQRQILNLKNRGGDLK